MVDKSDLHSNKQKLVQPDQLEGNLKHVYIELCDILSRENIKCYEWNNDYCAFQFELHIPLPSRGPIDGLDIREKEPILLLVHSRNYPNKPPITYADRKSFPRHLVPHANYTETKDLTYPCQSRPLCPRAK